MSNNIIVYSTIGVPALVHTDDGDIWEMAAVVSFDGGETCGPSYFNFETKEIALSFADQVNRSFPPLTIGEDE
jgi:hypothetical protein